MIKTLCLIWRSLQVGGRADINKKGEVPRKEWSDPLASTEEGFGE